jgi:hypothetical protein
MTNESPLDRAVRVIAGLALLSLTVAGPHSLWGLVGVAPLVTGLVGFCPAYRVLGIRTGGAPAAPGAGAR